MATNPSMPRRRHLAALPLLAAAAAVPGEARANAETWEAWADVGVRVVPLRRLRVTLTNGARFTPLYGLRRVVPELEVDYRVWGPLRVGVGYRYLWRRDPQGDVEEGHRVHGDVSAQFRVRTVDLELRTRLQWRRVDGRDHGLPDPEERAMWRNRFNVEWAFRAPFGANAFVEHWARLDGGPAHDRFRVGAGLSVEVARWRFRLFYQRDMPEFIDDPDVNMVGLSARLDLDLVRR